MGLNINSIITCTDNTTVAKSKPAKKRYKVLLSGAMRTIWLFLRKQKELIVGFGRHRATENTSGRTNWRGSAVLASLASTSQGSFHGPSTPPSWKKGTSAQNTSTSSVNCWKMSLDTAERNRTSASRSDRTAEHQSEKPNTFPNT